MSTPTAPRTSLALGLHSFSSMSMTIQPGTFEYILSGPPSRYLAAGDSGSVALRDGLASLGFTQDSLEDAVRAFQLKHNAEHPERPIKVDGKAGVQTLNAMYGAAAPGGVLNVEGRAQFLNAKNAVASMLGDPPPDAVKLKVNTANGIKHELNRALAAKQSSGDRRPHAGALSAQDGAPPNFHLEAVHYPDGTPATAPNLVPNVRDAFGHPLRERREDKIILNTTPSDGKIIPGVYDVNGRPMRERTDDGVILNTKPRDGEIIPGVYDVNGLPMRERAGDTIIK